jgi:uncharacterized protein
MPTGPYHAGERTVQRRAGVEHIADRLTRSIGTSLPEAAKPFLEAQPQVFVGARAADGQVWAGVLPGEPGFVHALDARTIRIEALPAEHDPLRGGLTAQRVVGVGLLALEPPTRRRLRVNGTAEVCDGGLLVRTAQVYANCPKYIQRRAPAQAGRPGTPVAARGADRLGGDEIALIRRADTFVIATAALDGSADASHRGGSPGFVAVDGEQLAFGDYAGNSMFNTLGNLEVNPHAGLLFVEPGTGDVLQLSGRAAVDWDPQRAAEFPGAERVIDFVVHELVRSDRMVPPLGSLIERSPHNPPPPVVVSASNLTELKT